LTTAIYPGSFDPITLGHLDIARRAAALFDHLVVAIYDTPNKNLLFSTAERVALAARSLEEIPNIDVASFAGLTVNYARAQGAKAIVRGLRAVSDFEVEMQMAHFNRKMAPEIDVVCLMTGIEFGMLNATTVKEIIGLGGPSEGLVPEFVAEAIRVKYRERRPR